MASVGHIRDLAQPSQVPAADKAKFGKFGVDVNDGFKRITLSTATRSVRSANSNRP